MKKTSTFVAMSLLCGALFVGPGGVAQASSHREAPGKSMGLVKENGAISYLRHILGMESAKPTGKSIRVLRK